jgi:hypothetical protein
LLKGRPTFVKQTKLLGGLPSFSGGEASGSKGRPVVARDGGEKAKKNALTGRKMWGGVKKFLTFFLWMVSVRG